MKKITTCFLVALCGLSPLVLTTACSEDDGPSVQYPSYRDLTYSESEFLSRDTEEGILYRDMENDAISQIVRYIEASRNPEESDRVEHGAQ